MVEEEVRKGSDAAALEAENQRLREELEAMRRLLLYFLFWT